MDAASGEEQMVLKKRLLNYLERYFYLVAFGAYCRQEGGPQVMHFVIDLNFALFVRTRAVQKVLCCLAGREEGHRGHGGEGDQGLGRDHLLQPQHEHAGLISVLNFCLSNFSENTSHPIPTETDTDPKPGYMGGCQGPRALFRGSPVLGRGGLWCGVGSGARVNFPCEEDPGLVVEPLWCPLCAAAGRRACQLGDQQWHCHHYNVLCSAIVLQLYIEHL